MKTNAMAGAVSLVGVGLCGIAVAMLLQVTGTRAEASSKPVDAFGPSEPTVVWYGLTHIACPNAGCLPHFFVARAWSDGRIEVKRVSQPTWDGGGGNCYIPSDPCDDWIVVSDPQQGYAAFADVNADELVDGADLSAVLGQWGPAPRGQLPPSECPLNLINP